MPKILLFGATGGVGLWIAHNILKNDQNQLKVAVRNKDKLQKLFKDRTEKFDEVFIMDFEEEMKKMEQTSENPFVKLMDGVDIVINAVGTSRTKDLAHSKMMDLDFTKALVEAGKTCQIKKFILVSSMFVTRPETFVAFILNTIVPNCLGHKIEAENYIR